MHQEFVSCIEACDACARACDDCASQCLHEGDVAAMVRCIALDIDCAQVCRLASAYMARNSEQAAAVCRFCADVCEACGQECAKHAHAHCQACAQACQQCADACRRMAQSGAAMP
jgi:hypothetical protein